MEKLLLLLFTNNNKRILQNDEFPNVLPGKDTLWMDMDQYIANFHSPYSQNFGLVYIADYLNFSHNEVAERNK